LSNSKLNGQKLEFNTPFIGVSHSDILSQRIIQPVVL